MRAWIGTRRPVATCARWLLPAAGYSGGNGLREPVEFSGDHASSLWSITGRPIQRLVDALGLAVAAIGFRPAGRRTLRTPLSAERNPYPLPGEDPNLTNGRSGQLPMA